MPDRISVFIDGGNLYHRVLKQVGIDDAGFDFNSFASFLAGDRPVGPYGNRYYVGTVREKVGDLASRVAMSKQTRLLDCLRRDGWHIGANRLVTRTEHVQVDERVDDCGHLLELGVHAFSYERTREKGIDVKLAVDLMDGAIDDQFDTAIVVSSDTDLLPALDWVRNKRHKKVEYVGFSIPNFEIPSRSTEPISALIRKTDIQRVLVGTDVQKFRKVV